MSVKKVCECKWKKVCECESMSGKGVSVRNECKKGV